MPKNPHFEFISHSRLLLASSKWAQNVPERVCFDVPLCAFTWPILSHIKTTATNECCFPSLGHGRRNPTSPRVLTVYLQNDTKR